MPQEPLVALNVMIPKAYKDRLDTIAETEFTSSAAVVRRAIRFFLDQAATLVDARPKGRRAGK